MSKWDPLKGKLEPKPLEDPSFRAKVDEAKTNYEGMPLKDLLFHFAEFDRQKDQLAEELKPINVGLAAIGQLIQARFQAERLNSVQTDFGKTVYLNVEPSVKVEDREVFEADVDAHEDLHYLWSVNAQTLKTLVKERIEELLGQGLHIDQILEQLPKGVRINLDTQVRIRKT